MHSWDELALISPAPMPVMPAPAMSSAPPSFTSAQVALQNPQLRTLSLCVTVRAALRRALQIDLNKERNVFEARVFGYQPGGALGWH